MELNEPSSDSDSDGTPCVEEVCVRQIVRNWEAELPSRRATSIGTIPLIAFKFITVYRRLRTIIYNMYIYIKMPKRGEELRGIRRGKG